MLPEERQKAIVGYLAQQGFSSVSELCKAFSVSEMTIRRDLDELQEQGLLRRTYGGAAVAEPAFFEVSLMAKMSHLVAEKERIGKAAAVLVRDGDVVLLSGGSTTHQVAKHLKSKRIKVVTNALNIASELLTYPHIQILVPGGILLKETASLVGPPAEAFLADVQADILFLGVEGVDVTGGLTLPDVIEAHTTKAMVRCARQTVVVADRTKLGRNALISIAPVAAAHLLITDKGAAPEVIEELRKHIEVRLV